MTLYNPRIIQQASSWRPSASINNLKKRAKILKKIRHFFDERNIMEVETPVLSWASVTDPHLHSITASMQVRNAEKKLYLQTSPEFAMKRLLAAGSGPIYQIIKSFRDDEIGRYHNPEFTMLEWYRPGFNHHDLMREMDEFLQTVLQCQPAKKYTYQAIFEKYFNINPHEISVTTLKNIALSHGLEEISGIDCEDKDIWLMRLMSDIIEPNFQGNMPYFIYDFPASQAALAKFNHDKEYRVASRFEVYYQGIELANGFDELSDPDEQKKRFLQDLSYREKHDLKSVDMDIRLLDALATGLPDCSGVALGIDRLIMLALACNSIDEIIAFPIERA